MPDWITEALPVLEAVYRAQRAHPNQIDVSQAQVNAELGREDDSFETDRMLLYLVDGGYIRPTATVDQLFGPLHMRLTDKGLQATAGWPSSEAEAFVQGMLAAFDERIASATDPDERSRLSRARDALASLGREILAEIIAGQVTRGV
jgi:hypothetical protein